jgi:glutathione synthase/RimK-type ligase-like ATP-grasp enzyme
MMTTRGHRPRVALVTCAELPDLDGDDRLALTALAERGIDAQPAVWDDPSVAWSAFDLAVLRSTWDYPERRDEFLAWARGLPQLANAAGLVAWNTDKRYLRQLAGAGAPVVETRALLADGAPWRAPRSGEWVVKPAVGAGSVDTGRYQAADREQRALAEAHVARLRAGGRAVLVQPYLPAVDTDGETALIFLGGRYSHAVRKGALLDGPYQGVDGLYRQEEISGRDATPAQLGAAEAVLRAVPGDLLYARVDLLPGAAGEPLLLELELTEPSLFLGHAPGAAGRFADAIAARLGLEPLGDGPGHGG